MATGSCRANEPLASSTSLRGEMATCLRFPQTWRTRGRICSAASKGKSTTMATQLAVIMMAAELSATVAS